VREDVEQMDLPHVDGRECAVPVDLDADGVAEGRIFEAG
jgi:hypothetical protein